ncbi:MAG: hypothetical protein JWO79_3074 [Actinomycetia bacterium]|nr:hypothetical protein [Actinomycetes bacterium]
MGAQILIVEDTPHNLQLMTYLLAAHGHDVVPAESGERAIELLSSWGPDLVVMDLQLPGIDGYEALSLLRATPGLAAIPVIAVTSFAMVGDRDLALAAGFDNYMTKPIEPETFTRDVVAYLPEELRGSQPTPAERAPATERIVPAAGNQPGADILVLDDSPTNQALLRSMLEPYGHHLRMSCTVEEAIAAAERTTPDLVLSDVHVGAQRGVDFLDHLRSVPALARVPFAFLTATADPRSPLVGDGTARVITRPIDTAALVGEIGTLLGSPVGV